MTKSTCWNCGQNGHTYSVCQEKRTRIFCYRCGHPEVTVKSCPTCTLSGSERGVRKERSIRTPTKDPALAPELPETCNLTSDTFGRSLSPPIPKSNFRPVNGCLYIPLNINGQSHDALVDSGSAYSYISLSESKGLPQTHLTTIDRIAVSFANGTREITETLVSLPVQVAKRNFTLNFFVLPYLTVPYLIGLDSLSSMEVVTDFSSHSWHFKSSADIFTFHHKSVNQPQICGIQRSR